MPAWLAVVPLLGSPSDLPPLVRTVQYRDCGRGQVLFQGRCINPVSAGDGGRGGDASVQVIIIPRGGDGGRGGDALGGGTGSINLGPTRISRCSLTIAGRRVVDTSNCNFVKITETKFKMSGSNYVWTVDHNQDRTAARGWLTGGRSPDVRDLGTMTPNGACWESTDGSVQACGWK